MEKRTSNTPERLKEAMRRAGKKQIDLSRETGLSHSTISRYLSGAVEPRQEATHKLSVALNVSEMWLWGYDVPMERTLAQKKNDQLAELIVRLRRDPELLEVVLSLADLPADSFDSIKYIVSALHKQLKG